MCAFYGREEWPRYIKAHTGYWNSALFYACTPVVDRLGWSLQLYHLFLSLSFSLSVSVICVDTPFKDRHAHCASLVTPSNNGNRYATKSEMRVHRCKDAVKPGKVQNSECIRLNCEKYEGNVPRKWYRRKLGHRLLKCFRMSDFAI